LEEIMENLLNAIRSAVTVSEALEQDIRRFGCHELFSKKQWLHRAGQVARQMYFIDKGAVRGYFLLPDGRDVSCYFGFEGHFACAVDSFVSGTPSIYYIEAIEDTVVYSISIEHLEELYDRHHAMERFGRLVIQQEYLALSNQHQSMQFMTAEQRYLQLLEKYPHVVQRVSIKDIASFLGINQETLSRIRSKYAAQV
jgi:CRP/FNR family transcriptional regulator, anaerobic regulatory protein